MEGEYLYSVNILEDVDIHEQTYLKLPSHVSAKCPGHNLLTRPLSCNDFEKGYVELLKQLTDVGTVTREMFTEKFKRMKSCKETYFITVMEDLTTGKIIGSGSLVLEEKFIHSCASRGRIEDIVVDSSYRGKQLGKYIVMLLTGIAKKLKCYKITLDCRDQMVPFYESLGYKKEPGNANYMTVRISD